MKERESKPSANCIESLILGGWRSLVFCVVVLVVVVLLAEYFLFRFRTIVDSGHQFEYRANGSIVWKSSTDSGDSMFFLPASAGWTRSGIILDPGEEVKINAVGRACLAMNRLVEAAQNGEKPPLPWVTPSGIALSSTATPEMVGDLGNESLGAKDLVVSGNIGALVCCVVPERGAVFPSLENNPRPDGVEVVGDRGEIENGTGERGELWFIVNDIVNPDESKGGAVKRKNYKARYWDDNIGNYWVIINR